MKKLLIILLVFALSSCRKEHTGCYVCSFGTINGVTPPPAEWCGDPGHQFKDAQGNDMQSFCVPK